MSVAVIIPASGQSNRFGAGDKLTAAFGSRSVVASTASAALASQASGVWVVVPEGACTLEASLASLGENPRFHLVNNADPNEGLSRSIRDGLAVLPSDVRGAAILPADLPAMSSRVIDDLIAAFVARDCEKVIAPVVTGEKVHLQLRNPVIWPRQTFGRLRGLSGDEGARSVLFALPLHDRHYLHFDDSHPFSDVDTPEALAALVAATFGSSD